MAFNLLNMTLYGLQWAKHIENVAHFSYSVHLSIVYSVVHSSVSVIRFVSV